MQIKGSNVIAIAVSALVVVGAGAALAQTQRSPSPGSSSPTTQSKTVTGSAFLDDVAKRLGIQRSKIDAALKAQALAEVTWAEDNQFITKAQADAIRQRIQSGAADGPDHPGFAGPFGPGVGPGGIAFAPGGIPFGPGGIGFGGRFGDHPGGGESLSAAASYLGVSESDLFDALRTKTLAQVAADHGKPVAGLEQALETAKKSDLDTDVTAGFITKGQADALLARFQAAVGDVVNGIPHSLTDLASRLGVDRSKLIAAIKGAATDQVDTALAQGLITKAQADAAKQRIRISPALPLGGLGFCGGPGAFAGPRPGGLAPPGPGRFGPGGPGFRPGGPGFGSGGAGLGSGGFSADGSGADGIGL
jgi:hypothetical protein